MANKPELLAPAGSMESLDAAIGEGADAVYLGLKNFNARLRSSNFTYPQFETLLRTLHKMRRKVYVTVNTVFEHREADRVFQLLKYLAGLGPDGIIVQDFGVVAMARENFPSLKIFASTQMNIASARGINFLSRQGVSRVILARELSLQEISEIRANTNVELEVFIHGALCISVSGICLFSSFLGGKSANRGMCTQPCRRFYRAGNSISDDAGEGYFFSPNDLQLLDKIPALADAGVDSFKIEGRMKSAEYVGTVVSAYRLVLDNLDAPEGKLRDAIQQAGGILKNDFARAKSTYFFDAGAGNDGFNDGVDWLNPEQSGGTGIPLGKLVRVMEREEGFIGLINSGVIDGKQYVPAAGDSVRLHKADDSDRVSHKLSFAEKAGGRSASSMTQGFWISIPENFAAGDSVFLIQTKSMNRHYPHVIGKGETRGRSPGIDRAPLPAGMKNEQARSGQRKNKTQEKPLFAPGIYVQVSRIEDLYILQSHRPEKVILNLNRKIINQIKTSKPLPFSPKDIIIFLDPFFPQEKESELSEAISLLIEKGYRNFILNNPGHFSFFKKDREKVSQQEKASVKERSSVKNKSSHEENFSLIAGPWLYSFNAWAWDFLAGAGLEYCVSPLENNRQNLERTFFIDKNNSGENPRSHVFITVLSRPSLFRMKSDYSKMYDFAGFSDNHNDEFLLSPSSEGTLVLPVKFFSIVDKMPFLKEAGFSRFILDLSSLHLKKNEYRDIMDSVDRAKPLPNMSRFNWKNGFFKDK